MNRGPAREWNYRISEHVTVTFDSKVYVTGVLPQSDIVLNICDIFGMKEIIYEKEYEVNSVNININKRLGLFGLLGICQDVGAIHAELMGVGLEEMIKNNAFWVLTGQKLKMSKWPKWQDIVLAKTWPRKNQGLKAYRDTVFYIGDEKIGESVATFMVLDGSTRRPIQPNIDESILKNAPRDTLDFIPDKIKVPENMKLENNIVVKNSDLDMNNHVNNTKYAQWILDTIPLEYHREFVVKEYDINFTSEARLGDEIDIMLITDREDPTEISSFYQGIRRSDKKIAFSSHIIAVKV